MPRFELTGIGRSTGKKRVRIFEAKDQEDAIMMAAADGTVVDMTKIRILPESPPTERQLNYAKDLGIPMWKGITKNELSVLISRAVYEKIDEEIDEENGLYTEKYQTQTIEKTGKFYKIMILTGLLLAALAIPIACGGNYTGAFGLGIVGMVVFVVGKTFAWWYHG